MHWTARLVKASSFSVELTPRADRDSLNTRIHLPTAGYLHRFFHKWKSVENNGRVTTDLGEVLPPPSG